MKIDKAAIAGTLESSDCMVTVEPGNGSVELELESVVMNQFGEQIQKVVRGDVGAPGCERCIYQYCGQRSIRLYN